MIYESYPSQEEHSARVRLRIFFSGVENQARTRAGEEGFHDAGLDYETDRQRAIATDDIYVLVFRQGGLSALVEDLTVLPSVGRQDGMAWLRGSFPCPDAVSGEQFVLVVLANLVQNQVCEASETVGQVLTGLIGHSEAEVYERLVYHLADKWNIDSRRIPMWGATQPVSLDPETRTYDSSCDLHRAVAKLGFLVNKDPDSMTGSGYPNLEVTGITVSGMLDRGYCVPSAHAKETVTTVEGHPFFTEPTVPADAAPLPADLTYSEPFQREFLNQILLPEMTADKELKITIAWKLHDQPQTPKEVVFSTEGPQGQTEEVIRNHSYIYNITLKKAQGKADLAVSLLPWAVEDVQSVYE